MSIENLDYRAREEEEQFWFKRQLCEIAMEKGFMNGRL